MSIRIYPGQYDDEETGLGGWMNRPLNFEWSEKTLFRQLSSEPGFLGHLNIKEDDSPDWGVESYPEIRP